MTLKALKQCLKKCLLGKKVNETCTGNVHGALKYSTWDITLSRKQEMVIKGHS